MLIENYGIITTKNLFGFITIIKICEYGIAYVTGNNNGANSELYFKFKLETVGRVCVKSGSSDRKRFIYCRNIQT